MSAPYNLSLLSNADGWVEYMLVFNYWSEMVWFTGIVFVFTLIIFTVSKYNLVPTPESLAYASFFGFIVSSLMWLFTYAGSHAVYTFIPVMYLFALAWSVVYIYWKSA